MAGLPKGPNSPPPASHTALCQSQRIWPWEGGSDRGGQDIARAWLGAAKAVVWRGKVPRVGSGYPGPSQSQQVQATFTHSSQLLVVMVSGQGEKIGQLNMNLKHLWSRELMARWLEKACLEGQHLSHR